MLQQYSIFATYARNGLIGKLSLALSTLNFMRVLILALLFAAVFAIAKPTPSKNCFATCFARDSAHGKATAACLHNCIKQQKLAKALETLTDLLSDSEFELCPDFQVIQSKVVKGTFTSRKDCARMYKLGQPSVFYPARYDSCVAHFSSPGCFLAGRAN